MSEVFREIEEDLRLERYRALALRYWRHAVAAVVLVVGGLGGHAIWTDIRDDRRASEADRYAAALAALTNGREAEAAADFNGLAREAKEGFRVLARISEAGALALSGDADAARAIYDRVAEDDGVAPHFRDLARLRAALLLLDHGSADDIRSRIGDLVEGDGPWRHLAREIDAHLAYRDSDPERARNLFRGIVGDPEAPPGVRARAREMLALWGGRDGS